VSLKNNLLHGRRLRGWHKRRDAASTLSAPSEKRNSLMPTAFCKSRLFNGGFRVQFHLKKIFKKLLDQQNIFRSTGSSVGKLTQPFLFFVVNTHPLDSNDITNSGDTGSVSDAGSTGASSSIQSDPEAIVGSAGISANSSAEGVPVSPKTVLAAADDDAVNPYIELESPAVVTPPATGVFFVENYDPTNTTDNDKNKTTLKTFRLNQKMKRIIIVLLFLTSCTSSKNPTTDVVFNNNGKEGHNDCHLDLSSGNLFLTSCTSSKNLIMDDVFKENPDALLPVFLLPVFSQGEFFASGTSSKNPTTDGVFGKKGLNFHFDLSSGNLFLTSCTSSKNLIMDDVFKENPNALLPVFSQVEFLTSCTTSKNPTKDVVFKENPILPLSFFSLKECIYVNRRRNNGKTTLICRYKGVDYAMADVGEMFRKISAGGVGSVYFNYEKSQDEVLKNDSTSEVGINHEKEVLPLFKAMKSAGGLRLSGVLYIGSMDVWVYPDDGFEGAPNFFISDIPRGKLIYVERRRDKGKTTLLCRYEGVKYAMENAGEMFRRILASGTRSVFFSYEMIQDERSLNDSAPKFGINHEKEVLPLVKAMKSAGGLRLSGVIQNGSDSALVHPNREHKGDLPENFYWSQ
jgi:hypothetical protein